MVPDVWAAAGAAAAAASSAAHQRQGSNIPPRNRSVPALADRSSTIAIHTGTRPHVPHGVIRASDAASRKLRRGGRAGRERLPRASRREPDPCYRSQWVRPTYSTGSAAAIRSGTRCGGTTRALVELGEGVDRGWHPSGLRAAQHDDAREVGGLHQQHDLEHFVVRDRALLELAKLCQEGVELRLRDRTVHRAVPSHAGRRAPLRSERDATGRRVKGAACLGASCCFAAAYTICARRRLSFSPGRAGPAHG